MAIQSLQVRTCQRCGTAVCRMRRLCLECYRERRRHSHRRVEKRCVQCGAPFMAPTHTKRPNNFCSTSCATKTQKPRRLATCPRCGVEFWPWANGKRARKFCSRQCSIPPKKAKLPSVRIPVPREQRQCRWCAAPFLVSANKERKYCSKRHQLIAKSRRRKAIIRNIGGELPSIWAIYERDKGRCWICRKKVPRTAVWPDRRCASLDHVIPITKGGRDEATNVRLAHVGCNSKRQASIDTLF
jgi:hypothetical protein